MSALYIKARIITPFVKFLVCTGSKRLKHKLSRKLDCDLSHMVSFTSSYLNKFWDIYNGDYPDQPHHTPKYILSMLFNSMFTILWLIILSYLPKNQKN